MINFPCLNPKCESHVKNQKLAAKDEKAGETLPCPACKTNIMVPTASVAKLIETHIAKHGQTDFHKMMLDAAAEGYVDMVDWLFKQNKNLVYAKGESGRTLMHYAAAGGKVNVMELMGLLITDDNEWNAVVKAKDDDGFQPIHSAAIRGQTKSLTCLVELGVDVNEKDKDGMTPLHIVAEQGKIASIECLVRELNADVNAGNNEGATPLFAAAFEGQTGSMDCLYALGAKLVLKNGITLKKLADAANLTEVQEWLRAKEYISKLSGQLVAPGSTLAGQIANSKSLGAPPIVKPVASKVLEQLSPEQNQLINQLEAGIRSIEDSIFDDGPFTAHKMKETLGFLATSIRIAQMQRRRHSGISILEKKDDYQKNFDDISETITDFKEPLKALQAKYGHDNRLASLIERCEKCEIEILKLRDAIRNYSEY